MLKVTWRSRNLLTLCVWEMASCEEPSPQRFCWNSRYPLPFFLFLFAHHPPSPHTACGVLVPRPGLNPSESEESQPLDCQDPPFPDQATQSQTRPGLISPELTRFPGSVRKRTCPMCSPPPQWELQPLPSPSAEGPSGHLPSQPLILSQATFHASPSPGLCTCVYTSPWRNLLAPAIQMFADLVSLLPAFQPQSYLSPLTVPAEARDFSWKERL